jgi:predicted metalloprotease with PDZ domain
MPPMLEPRRRIALVAPCALACWTLFAHAQPFPSISYRIRTSAPESHLAEIEAVFPTGSRPSVDLMMAIWSPGFYRIENYATRIRQLTAKSPDGATLAVTQPQPNRWHIETGGAARVVVDYQLFCNERSVTTNYVGADLGVFNGPATFITLADHERRPHDVVVELPPAWPRAITGLDRAADGRPNHFEAPDFDTLADSPIMAGDLKVQQFDAGGKPHFVVEGGEVGDWDGERAAADLDRIVEQEVRLLGSLPYRRYVYLLVFRRGGGGLEHLNSTLATTSPDSMSTPAAYHRWLAFISHEYFHAFNVKRLRPVELGPFDYEHEPHTPSLWISEGWTTYFGELLVARARLTTRDEYLKQLSGHIDQLQKTPGRLVQSLEQASLNVWTESMSGTRTDAQRSVSYYVKGPVVGFLLDARIRHETNGARSLDDLMRLAYGRYGGARGFTPEQFRAAAEEVAGTDLKAWWNQAIASPGELDYTEALEWFGLRFAPGTNTLEVREDATEAQRAHLHALLSP